MSVTNLEGQVLSVDYGVGGLVKALHRFDGSSVTNAYDARGRLARTDYPGGAYEFAYLANDLPSSVTHGADTVVYGYDRWNQPVAVTNTAAGLASAAAYAYDAAGNLTNRVTVAGATGYAYDAGERLTALEGPDGTTAYAYNAWNGLIETETRAGLTVGYAYDAVARVTDIEYRDAASNLVYALKYNYDAVGMITQKVSRTVSATNAVAYAYDELDRLIREDDGATAREYDFDLAGNRLAMRVIGGGATNAVAYALGTANRLASWTGGGACAYDAAGCVTNLVRSGKPAVALEWDGQYRVTAAYTNGVLAESYGYDALGRRATVSTGGVTTHFINEGPHVIAETDAAGNLLRRYAYGPGVDDLLTLTDFGGGVTNTYYYIKDIQNTVLEVRNAAGAIVETYDYDAWGNIIAVRDGSGNPLAQSAIGNRFLFQGREYSWATGLYNFRARWYDPETGRWLSNDPIGISGGLNQYEFCSDNPALYSDAFGLAADINLVDPADPYSQAAPFVNAPRGGMSVLVHGEGRRRFSSQGPHCPPQFKNRKRFYRAAHVAQALIAKGLKSDQDVYIYSCEAAEGQDDPNGDLVGGDESNIQAVADMLDILMRGTGGYHGKVHGPSTVIYRGTSSDSETLGTRPVIVNGRIVMVPGEWISATPRRAP